MMNTTLVITLIALVVGLLVVHYIDARYQCQFMRWLEGEAVNPFARANISSSRPSIAPPEHLPPTAVELAERVAALETIVTDQRYELDRKIAKL